MKLIFIYNADSGVLNTVKDIGHKLFSPDTYDCLLCSLTHGTFRENPEWKTFREHSTYEMVFMHRDEFEKNYAKKMEYPVILKETNTLDIAISKEELESFKNLTGLIDAVQQLEKAG
ncbi:GTPase [Desulfosediminicola flagellatus]|uniref:GTPase n=1 Tax=Desulfosediminicola flagellatus TaxID=2569541 RepID=UPI0010AB87CA|nr:GTPase [Desulfosediminicola flagellatus]